MDDGNDGTATVINFENRSLKRKTTSTGEHKAAGIPAAKKAARTILACYPDYGKAPPEYIVNLIDVLATFPAHVLPMLCDLRTGIPAECSFLPTVSDVVKMGDRMLDRADRDANAKIIEDARIAAADRTIAETEKKAKWWAERSAILANAQKKYTTAFLNGAGELMYCPAIENAVPLGDDKFRVGAYEFKRRREDK